MNIGREVETIIVTPVETPVPERRERPAERPTRKPIRRTEPAPGKPKRERRKVPQKS